MLWTFFTLSSLPAFFVGAAVAFAVNFLAVRLVSSLVVKGLGFVKKEREDEKTEDKVLGLGERDEGGLDKKLVIVAMDRGRERDSEEERWIEDENVEMKRDAGKQ